MSTQEELSLSLKSKDISAQEAFKAASLTKSYYNRQTNDENFDKFYLSVLQESERTEHVKEPKLPKLRKVPKCIDGGAESHVYQTPKEHYRQIFLKLLIVSVAKLPTALVSHHLHPSKAWKKFY